MALSDRIKDIYVCPYDKTLPTPLSSFHLKVLDYIGKKASITWFMHLISIIFLWTRIVFWIQGSDNHQRWELEWHQEEILHIRLLMCRVTGDSGKGEVPLDFELSKYGFEMEIFTDVWLSVCR